MIQDNKVAEINEEMKYIEKRQKKGVLENMPTNTKLIFLAALGLLTYAIYTQKIDRNSGLLLMVVIGAIIYFTTTTNRQGILTEQECAIKLYGHLKFKQAHPLGEHYEIDPYSKIIIRPLGKLLFMASKPWKRMMSVEIYNPETYDSEYYRAEIDVYNGDLVGMEYLPGGFLEMDTRDVKWIAKPDLFAEKKYQQYTGRYYDGRRGGP